MNELRGEIAMTVKIMSSFACSVLFCCFSLLLSASCSHNQPTKMHTVGVINFSPAAELAYKGFKEGMADLGYVENKNIRYIYSGAIQDKMALETEGKRLVDAKVDLIFAMSTPGALVAKAVSEPMNIPVVFAPVSNPVGAGIVDSMKRPGGNVTGVTFLHQEPKRFEYFNRIVPHIRRIAFPYNPKDKSPLDNLKNLTDIAETLEVELVPFQISSDKEIDNFLSVIPKDVDAIYMPTDSLMASRIHDFAWAAREWKLPLSTPQQEGVRAGALMSYGFSVEDTGRQAAHLAAQIFQGLSPADLPVEIAEFVVTVNLKTAREIGVSIPEHIIRLSTVIQE